MLDLDLDAVGDVYDYVGLKDYVASLFPGPVDVVNRAGLKPFLRPPAEAEAVSVF
jgi:predicted nucleotidyltransferase